MNLIRENVILTQYIRRAQRNIAQIEKLYKKRKKMLLWMIFLHDSELERTSRCARSNIQAKKYEV